MESPPPKEWDEAAYLIANPDVAAAVERREFRSGWSHYLRHGQYENRDSVHPDIKFGKTSQTQFTRDCSDPWTYLEVTPDLKLRPCCNFAPIVDWESMDLPIEDIRDTEPFKQLRNSLMTGKLSSTCASCHMRPMTRIKDFQERFTSTQALPLAELRIDITTRCNLRCVYCAVSQPSYLGMDLQYKNFSKIIELVKKQPSGIPVWVNGHGETTYHPQWVTLVNELAANSCQLHMTTNLAKQFDQEELDCLSKLATIQVSIDTIDSKQLKEIRQKVKLSTIVKNIQDIRRSALNQNLYPPLLKISCVVYDLNYSGLPELAKFAIDMDVKAVTFWPLVKYDDIPGVANVQPVPVLGSHEIQEAVAKLNESRALLEQAGVIVVCAGGFDEEWGKLLEKTENDLI